MNGVNQEFSSTVYNIIGFIDNNQQKYGTDLTDIKIFSPEMLVPLISENNAVLVIAVKDSHSIEAQLERLGINSYLTFQEFVREEKLTRQLVPMSLMPKLPKGLVRRLQIKEEIIRMRDNGFSYKDAKEKLGSEDCISGMAGLWVENIETAERFIKQEVVFQKRKKGKCEAVAFCTNRFYNGGVERVLSHLIKLFVEQGMRVILISEHQDNCVGEYELPNQVERYETVIYSCHPDIYVLQIARILKEEQPDVLCMHIGFDSRNYYLGLLAAEYETLFVSEIHSRISLSNDRFRLLYKYTDKIVTLTEDWAKHIDSLGLQGKYIPNPVFLPLADRKEYIKSDIILWVGRVENIGKHIYDTVDVMQSIVKQRPKTILKIVGDADDQKVYNNLVCKIKNAGLERNILLAGYHTDVSPFYREAAVLIMTSSSESFGMVIAEALGYGVPVVMYDLPYLELVKMGKGIITVPQGDTEEMARVVMDLLDNPKILGKLSKEALENATFFSKIDIMAKWKDVFVD